jgi:hypothetical protein
MKKYRVKMMKMKILMKIINQMISIQIAEWKLNQEKIEKIKEEIQIIIIKLIKNCNK